MKRASRLIAAIAFLATGTAMSGSAIAADNIDLGVSPTALPWYIELLAGGPIPRDYDATLFGTAPIVYDPDPGFMISGAIGKYFTPNIRADLNVSYAWANDGAVSFVAAPAISFPHTGRVTATTILGSVYYEFQDVMPNVTPWVGVGAGATIFNYSNLGATGGAFTFDDSDTAFTAAGHLGFDYAININIDFTARYSLTYTGSHNVTGQPGNVALAADSQVNNIFMAGFRFKFGN
jgi:outer membrane protein W